VVDDAVVPFYPVSPVVGKIVLSGLGIGLLLGGLVAFLRRTLYGKLHDANDIEQKLGLSVYGVVPRSAAQEVMSKAVHQKERGIHILAHTSRNDAAVESLRSFRTACQFALLEARNNVVLFTGATPGVGKSFVSANYAALMADAGKRVLLVDGDMRKGYLDQYFGLNRQPGLSDWITDVDGKPLDAFVKTQVLPGLDVLPAGRRPPNPAELVVSQRFSQLVERWSAEYDLVVIDTPPVMLTADTAAMAAHAGMVFLVARAEVTTLSEVGHSARLLQQSGVVPQGVVFNGMDMSKRRYSYGYGGAYGYRYGYRYGQQYLSQMESYQTKTPQLGR